MNTIGSVSQLVSVIRSELSAGLAGKARSSAPGRKPGSAGARYAEQKLGGLIAMRIGRIGADDPQRGRKAFRVFLEAVLLARLGEDMVADPKFHQMLDQVQSAMEADPACDAMMAVAVAQLLSGAASRRE